MDRLSKIEEQMALLLTQINKTTQPDGYSYYSQTGSVLIEDENVAMALNADDSDINYLIEQFSPERIVVYSEGANAITSSVQYKITAQCYNEGTERFPKRAIILIMNQVLSDLKFLFANNSSLNKTCNWFKIYDSRKVFTANNDVINTGNLELMMELNYSQAIFNPDVNACI